MTKSAFVARILPAAAVAAVLAASLLIRPVSLNYNTVALCGYGYGYGTGPAVDSVNPSAGPTAGGTSVTLTGCGFTGATSVKFGTTSATFSFVSDTTINATSPAHVAGVVDVSVTTPLGTSPAQAGDQFNYGWSSVGGVLTSGPDASSWTGGRHDAFVRGSDNAMYHNGGYNGNWLGYEGLGGVLTSDPGAVSWGFNRIDIFVRGTDNAMYHRWWDGSHWQGWEPQGGVLTSGPDVASWG